MNEERTRVGPWWLAGALAFVLALALLVPALVAPAAAQDDEDDAEEDATGAAPIVRVVHASPDAPAVDVLIDGQPAVQNLAFGTASGYVPTTAGEHQLAVVPTGQTGAPVIEETIDVDEGKAYIAIALGVLAEIELKFNEVNLEELDAGKVRLRVIHASPDAGEVDIAVAGGDELFGGVEFKDDTDYTELDAGAYTIEVRSDDTAIVSVPDLQLENGKVYDVIALGQVADQSLTLLPLITNVSRPCGEVIGIGGEGDACVRVVHAHPDIDAADVYLGGNAVAEGVAFGQASDFMAVPAGDDVAIQVTAAGQAPPTGDEADDETIDLEAGQAYEIVAWTDADEADTDGEVDVQIDLHEVDLTPLPEGQARLRVIHASGDAGDVDVVTNGTTLFDNVGEGDAADFEVVNAGAYPLQVTDGDGENPIFDVDADIQAAMVYDAVALGRVGSNTFSVLLLAAPAEVREAQDATPIASPQTGATPVTDVDTEAEDGGAVDEAEDVVEEVQETAEDAVDGGEEVEETAEAGA